MDKKFNRQTVMFLSRILGINMNIRNSFIINNPTVGAPLAGARNNDRAGTSPAPTLGSIIRAFKSLSTNAWSHGKFWQRNYYEHIINNPQMWKEDRNNPENLYV